MTKRVFAALIAVFLLGTLLAACGGTEQPKNTEPKYTVPGEETEAPIPFEEPEAYACILQVVMDPALHLYLGEEGEVVAVRYLNQQALDVFGAKESEIVGSDPEKMAKTLFDCLSESKAVTAGDTVMLDITGNETGEFADLLSAVQEAFTKANHIGCKVQLLSSGENTEGGVETEPEGEPGGEDTPVNEGGESAQQPEEGGEVIENQD